MPFITEELWETLSKRNEMLVHCDWPEYDSALIDHAADLEMNWVVNLIESIRSARSIAGTRWIKDTNDFRGNEFRS